MYKMHSMMQASKMKKTNSYDLVLLIFYCICILFCAVVLGYLTSSIIILFKIGTFNFDWKIVFPIALKKGCAGGLVLGLGIWIKAKLQERRDKN